MSSTPVSTMNEPPNAGGRLAQGDSAPSGSPPAPASPSVQPRAPGGRFAKGTGGKPKGKTKGKRPAPRFEVNDRTGGIRRVEQYADPQAPVPMGLKVNPERAPDGKFGKGGTRSPSASKARKEKARKREANGAKERARVEAIQKGKGNAEKAPPFTVGSSAAREGVTTLASQPERAPDGKFGKGSRGPTGPQKVRSQRRAERKDVARKAQESTSREKEAGAGKRSAQEAMDHPAPAMTVDPTTPLETPADLHTSRAVTFATPRFVAAPLPAFQPVARPQGPVTPMVAPRVIVGR